MTETIKKQKAAAIAGRLFEQCPAAHTRYKLIAHRGVDIPDFPAQWVKDGKAGKAGEKYVGFRETVNRKPGHQQFSHTVELDKGRTVTGVNFAPEFPRLAFGDYRADALLIEFSETWGRLTIRFFRGMKEAAQNLFQSWQAGEIPETTAADGLAKRPGPISFLPFFLFPPVSPAAPPPKRQSL
jgi:hypothetical protein